MKYVFTKQAKIKQFCVQYYSERIKAVVLYQSIGKFFLYDTLAYACQFDFFDACLDCMHWEDGTSYVYRMLF